MGDPNRTFPVLAPPAKRMVHRDCPYEVPWAFAALGAVQAYRNHGRSLERLAQRGGLSPGELVCAVEGRPLPPFGEAVDWAAAVARLNELVRQYHPEGVR